MRTSALLLSLLPCVFVLAGCGKAPAPAAKAAPRDASLVEASPQLMRRLQFGGVEEAELRDLLRVPGRVEVDETRVAFIGSPVRGRLIDLEVREGDQVKRGDILATLTSTELTDTQRDFLRAYSQKLLAERAAARAKQLFDADVIGSAEMQRREVEAVQASAEMSAARDQLKVLGMSEKATEKLLQTRTIDSTAHVVSSISGTVIERKVTHGQVVQPADKMFVVADLSNVWVIADIPEQNAGAIKVGQPIDVEIPAIPNRHIRGAISFVSPAVNPDTRTVRVRMDLPNQERDYKPAMLATAQIRGGPQKRRVVPAAAVVREENREYVFVQTAPTTFQLRSVRLGEEIDGSRVLIAGLQATDRIVVEGAFHLNNERRQRALERS